MRLRRDPLSKLEAEVIDLEGRHASVCRRLDAAVTEAEQAVVAQRLILVAEHADAAQARRAADAVRTAADRRAALEDAARSLATDLQDARQRRDAERDRRARDSVATEFEARAARIEAAAAALDVAAMAFDRARQTVLSVCRDDAERSLLGFGPEYGIVGGAARLAGLTAASPVADKTVAGDAPGPDASTVARRVGDGLRAKAQAVRHGAVPAVIPNPSQTVPSQPIAWPVVRVVLARGAFYRQANGHQVQVQAGGCDLPEPVAATAIEIGVGFEPRSDQARQILGILAANPSARIEANGIGGFRANNVGSIYGREPEPAPANLGALPDINSDGVFLAEAAQ